MLGDGAGLVLDANQQALDLFGYSLEELCGSEKWLICDASDPRFHESIQTRASEGRSDFEMRLIRKDGSVFEARIWSVLFEEAGQRRSWIGVTPRGETGPARSILLRANAMLSSVIAGAPDGIIVVDDDGKVVHVNDPFLHIWDLDRSFALLPPLQRRQAAMPLLKEPEAFTREMAALESDRDLVLHDFVDLVDGRTLEMHSHPLNAPGGERIGRIWYYSDVTAAMEARAEIAFRDALLEAQFELSRDALIVVAQDGTALRFNRQFLDLWGITREQMSLPEPERMAIALPVLADPDAFQRMFDGTSADAFLDIDEQVQFADGRTFEVVSSPFFLVDGTYIGRAWAFRDISARLRGERALEAANTLLSAQFEHAPHATLVLASDGSFIRASDSFFEFSGLPREWADLPQDERRLELQKLSIDPEKSAAFNDRWRQHPGEDLTSEFKLRDGRYFEVRSRPLRGPDDETLGRIFFYSDITERRKAESVLRESEAQLRTLLDALEEGVVLFNASGDLVLANAAASRVLGSLDEFTSRNAWERRWLAIREDGSPFPPSEFPVAAALTAGTVANNVVVGVNRSAGDTAWLLVSCVPLFEGDSASPTGAVASFVDITERRKLEASAARLRQHESLAVLAGGVSHKLNNLLTSIIGNAWVAAQMPNLPEELRESVSDISNAAESAAALVGDLRSFAAPSYMLSAGVALNDCVGGAIAELPPHRRERLALQLGAALPQISANADGLRRAIVNLIENAFDAGSETVEVRTRLVTWEPAANVVFSATEPAPGTWLSVEIEDNGQGMERWQAERAFEPFYTTGFAGSGLGLPAAAGIVREHGGYVGIESTPGKGTVARIFLPIAG